MAAKKKAATKKKSTTKKTEEPKVQEVETQETEFEVPDGPLPTPEERPEEPDTYDEEVEATAKPDFDAKEVDKTGDKS